MRFAPAKGQSRAANSLISSRISLPKTHNERYVTFKIAIAIYSWRYPGTDPGLIY